MRVECRTVLEERQASIIPAGVCPDWLIFNAARPIPGTATWQGDFLHGVFYAAIDPADERAAYYLKECVSLDGHLLVFVSREWVVTATQQYYDTHFKNEVNVAAHSFGMVWRSYLEHVAPQTVDIELEEAGDNGKTR